MVGSAAERLPEKLLAILSALPGMAIAFSGGLDSRFLCHAAYLCGREILLLHACGPHVPKADSAFARCWAASRSCRFVELRINPLSIPQVATGEKERCYYCKSALFEAMHGWLRQNDLSGLALCDGANGDDLLAYRPGNRAARELGVRSPLAEAGLAKNEIRALAAATGLDAPEQKARPCLLTRLAYGMPPNRALLEALESAEEKIGKLLQSEGFGHAAFRLRLEPAPALHVNSVSEELAAECVRIAEKCGFGNCGLRFSEEISGFFDSR